MNVYSSFQQANSVINLRILGELGTSSPQRVTECVWNGVTVANSIYRNRQLSETSFIIPALEFDLCTAQLLLNGGISYGGYQSDIVELSGHESSAHVIEKLPHRGW